MSNPENIGINGNAIVEIHHIFGVPKSMGKEGRGIRQQGVSDRGKKTYCFALFHPFGCFLSWSFEFLIRSNNR